ncbi:MAG: WXG100 family type VII secretion target [Chloroflexi bacterium]|nr:WXG100 family type VII secretion target [Chloroflexota bacterium]
MNGIDVQMDYEVVEQMIKIFDNGANQLTETMQAMQAVAQKMRSGALLGLGGDDFADALEKILAPRIQKLIDKFRELSCDVKFAKDAIQRGDMTARGRFL